jgi:catechol 2,3-dioxygenase-like lactoylglutathione lyase family enzyme
MLTGIFKKQVPKYPVNPRFRAYGKARLDIAKRAANGSDWDRLWKEPAFPFPFDWGEWWKQCIEYKVEDFAAEVGFYTDILGLPVVAFDPNYAMFTSPSQDFFLAVVPALEPGKSTPSDALRIQFMVADIFETVRELERRGIVFEQKPQPCERGSLMYITYFRTPHGLCVDLWGIVQQAGYPDEEPGNEEGEVNLQSERVNSESHRPERAHPDQAEHSGPAYETGYRESEWTEKAGIFLHEEDEAEVDQGSGLRFFVEPASELVEPDEGEAKFTPGELNFGFFEPESEVSKTPRHSREDDEEEALEQVEEDFEEEEEDFEDEDSSPYEYVDLDDV